MKMQCLSPWQKTPPLGVLWSRHTSTTQHFEREHQKPLLVQSLKAYQAPCDVLAAPFLGSSADKAAWHREVLLSLGKQPVMWAYSVVLCEALLGRFASLPVWGKRSLGDLLFKSPACERTQFQYAKALLPHWGEQWVRVSIFTEPECQGRLVLFESFL